VTIRPRFLRFDVLDTVHVSSQQGSYWMDIANVSAAMEDLYRRRLGNGKMAISGRSLKARQPPRVVERGFASQQEISKLYETTEAKLSA
jgi:hypothetical protein